MNLKERFSKAIRARVITWLTEGDFGMLLSEKEKKAQSLVALARKYYAGDHEVFMTDRQKAWLDKHGGTVKFTVNHCPTVVDSIVERLKVTGFDVGDDNEEAAKLLQKWTSLNRFDALQIEAHRMAVRDGDAFILTEFIDDRKIPKQTLHQRFVDKSVGGDGYGMWIEYPNDDYLAEPIRAFKQWTEKDDDGKPRDHRTVYYPEKVEKFVKEDNGKWVELEVEGEEWPVAWVGKDRAPLGIAVKHIRNPNTQTELKDVIPLQDALNKAWLDIMAASDSTAFRILFALGFIPTTDGEEPKSDGSNLLQITPGQMLSTLKKPGDAELTAIDPATLEPLLAAEERIVFRIATVSDTPIHRFLATKQVSSDASQKQGEAPLIAKVEERQTLFGNGWEDVMLMALKVHATFGGGEMPESDMIIRTQWADPHTRNDEALVKTLKVKSELGVPDEQVWREMNYDEKKIKEFLAQKREKDAEQLRVLARMQGKENGTKPNNGSKPAEERVDERPTA